MLVIDTYLAPDQYGGRAVFAAKPIKKGDIVWRYDEAATRIITIPEYVGMIAQGGELAHTLKTYCYPAEIEVDGRPAYVLLHDLDNGSFMNHDDAPNTGYITSADHPHYHEADQVNIALRDIAAGEQLTFDYFEFVEDLAPWAGIETCMQFLFDMGHNKTLIKKAS